MGTANGSVVQYPRMGSTPAVLLTNDDGIASPGIEAIREAVSTVADVTVIAPATNQSGASRADSRVFDAEPREHGYAVQGTPADCVQFGIGTADPDFDLVISGCNDGPNLGDHRLTRSGTVAGAIEGAFLGVPGIALSVYDPPTGVREFYPEDYEQAGRLARFLTAEVVGTEWEFDYLNVNVPATAPEPRVRVTEPVSDYDVRIDEIEPGRYRVWDHFWDPLQPDTDVEVTDPVGTDRRAVADEEVSVTPLRIGHRTADREEITALGRRFEDQWT